MARTKQQPKKNNSSLVVKIRKNITSGVCDAIGCMNHPQISALTLHADVWLCAKHAQELSEKLASAVKALTYVQRLDPEEPK